MPRTTHTVPNRLALLLDAPHQRSALRVLRQHCVDPCPERDLKKQKRVHVSPFGATCPTLVPRNAAAEAAAEAEAARRLHKLLAPRQAPTTRP